MSHIEQLRLSASNALLSVITNHTHGPPCKHNTADAQHVIDAIAEYSSALILQRDAAAIQEPKIPE